MANLPAKRGKKGKIAEPLLEASYWDWLLGGDIRKIAELRGLHYNTVYSFISSTEPKDVAIHDRLKDQYNKFMAVERQRQVKEYAWTVQDQFMRITARLGRLVDQQYDLVEKAIEDNGGKIPLATKTASKTTRKASKPSKTTPTNETAQEGGTTESTVTQQPMVELKDLLAQWHITMQPFWRSQERVQANEPVGYLEP